MYQLPTLRLSSWARLVTLSLLLLVGLLASLGLASRTAHAQPAATLTVTDCSGETGPGRIGTVISSASPGDTIKFSCSGTIPITSHLVITESMTLDGSGQMVTLDGGGSTQVLQVKSGVSFTLNALTIAHGFWGCDICDGGGLFNEGMLTITNSTFSGNSANEFGGGLANENGGTVSISNSTFSGNSAPNGVGGGLYNDGTVSISNSTFANNSAPSFGGGGLDNENGGTASISNSTFSGNSAPSGSGGGLANNLFENGGTVSIGGSIVAKNTGGDCNGGGSDQGYNLSSDSSCGFTGTGSLQNTNPRLGPLASNGGPTQTMALLKGSLAIDYIPLASALCPATDQRGHKRPDNPKESACDIGAYES